MYSTNFKEAEEFPLQILNFRLWGIGVFLPRNLFQALFEFVVFNAFAILIKTSSGLKGLEI
jgi:hypothetical protein